MKYEELISLRNCINKLSSEQIMKMRQSRKKHNVWSIMFLYDFDCLKCSLEINPNNEIIKIYLKLVGIGIIAIYDVDDDQWYRCYSHGTDDNYMCDNTYTSEKVSDIPSILYELIEA